MKELKGTKTEKNLLEAFAGESMARNKYTYYASKAKKDGFEQIAAIFEETAQNEKEHAKLWFKYLEGGAIKETLKNLEDAANGENYEWTDMYERMAKEAEEEGFKIKQGKDVYSSEYAEGRVCLQDPEPGVETPKEGTITINLSKGSKEGLVPNVVGMQEDEVAAYLESHGYVLGTTKTITSPEKAGTVLEQDPVAGSTLDKESKINIKVSDGKGVEKGTVPSVTRMSLEEAQKAIKKAGFKVGNISYDWDEDIGKGYVIYQNYQANSQLDKGTAIDLQVSSGPEPKPEEPSDHDSTDEEETEQ